MENIENILRNIPQVEKLVQQDEINVFIPILGHNIVVTIIREEVAQFREEVVKGESLEVQDLLIAIIERCKTKRLEKLQRVINGTGVVIHTNLGRAPISNTILENLNLNLSGYCNLELDLPASKRGKRGGFTEELISSLTNGEDALIVNNNASSLFLILSEFAKDRDVIISRGELIQIGGGFRIPDIMRQTGANLCEVGTTNITELDDYKKAITDNTAMILSVHQSNFKIQGFSSSPNLKELSTLKSQSRIFVRDLGSGNLVLDARFPDAFEPTISSELAQGADLVCFSGDKLLGGCQAGIIVGHNELIKKLRSNPLMRMLRVDKITYFLLQETLILYANREMDNITVWNLILQNKKTINNRVNRVLRKIKSENKKDIIKKVTLKSVIGGGSLPTLKIESTGLQINLANMNGEDIYKRFISLEVPITGYIMDDSYTLDFRTIFDDDIPEVISAIEDLIEEQTRS